MTTLRLHRVLLIATGLLALFCFNVRGQAEEVLSNALTAVDIIRIGDPDDDMIVGEAGRNYPTYAEVPDTAFSCEQQGFPGYFADQETQCQVFHICVTQGQRLQKFSFLCPNGTIFNQQYFVCVWWYDFDCGQALSLYSINNDIFGDAPSAFPGNVLGDVTGTGAASTQRDRPNAARFPAIGGSGVQGDRDSNRGTAEDRRQFPTVASGSGTGGQLPSVSGTLGGVPTGSGGLDTRGGQPTVAGGLGTGGGQPTVAGGFSTAGGQPTVAGGFGTAGGQPAVTGGFGTAGGQPTVAGGFGTAGGQPTVAGGFGTAGGQPAVTGGFGTAGGQPTVAGGFGTAGGQPTAAGGFGTGGGQPTVAGGFGTGEARPTFDRVQGTRGGLPASVGDQSTRGGTPSSETSQGLPERLPSSISNAQNLGESTSNFGIPTIPEISGSILDSSRRPGTSGGRPTIDGNTLFSGQSQLSDDDGKTDGFSGSVDGSSVTPGFGISQSSNLGTPFAPGIRPGIAVSDGEAFGLPVSTGTTRPGITDANQGFSRPTPDISGSSGSFGPGFPPLIPGDGLDLTGISGQISGLGATSGTSGFPGKPASKPDTTGFITSSASPSTAGLISDISGGPVGIGGFGTPGTATGLTSQGGLVTSADKPGSPLGISDSSSRPFSTSDFPGAPGAPGAPGLETGTGIVGGDFIDNGGIRESVSEQGVFDSTSLIGRPETTDPFISSIDESSRPGVQTGFQTENLPSEGILDGLLPSIPGKPATSSGQSSFETSFGSSPSVSDKLQGGIGSITNQLDLGGRITTPGIGDSLATSFSLPGSQGASPVSSPFDSSFESAGGFDQNIGVIGGVPESNIGGTGIQQYDQPQVTAIQSGFQNQEQSGVIRPQFVQDQGISALEQGQNTQVSSLGPNQVGFSAVSQDKEYTGTPQGQVPSPELVAIGQGQSGQQQTLTGLGQTSPIIGQIDEVQRQTVGTSVQGQDQIVSFTQTQGNQGYSYPTPLNSLTPSLGVETTAGSQITDCEDDILGTDSKNPLLSTQHNIQGSEVHGLKGAGNINDQSNILISQVSSANQLFQDNFSYTDGLNTQNQPAHNTVNGVLDGGQSSQGYTYDDLSANSFSVNTDQTATKTGSSSVPDISNAHSISTAIGTSSVGVFSSGGFSSNNGNIVSGNQQPLSDLSVNNPAPASLFSLADNINQEVQLSISQAKPPFNFNSPQNSVSAVDLAALQQGYLPPANEIKQSSSNTKAPSTGLSLPTNAPLSTAPSFPLPNSFVSESALIKSPGNQGSAVSLEGTKDIQFGTSDSLGSPSASAITQGSYPYSTGQTSHLNNNQVISGGTSSFVFPSVSQSSGVPGGPSTSTSKDPSTTSPFGTSGTQVSSIDSKPFSSSFQSFSQGNGNINVGSITGQNSSPLNLGYLPPVRESTRNINQVGQGQNVIYVTPVSNRNQRQAAPEQRSNAVRIFKPSLILKNEKSTSEFIPKSSSNGFGRIFFPSNRPNNGFPITYVGNTMRSFIAQSRTPLDQYNLLWKS